MTSNKHHQYKEEGYIKHANSTKLKEIFEKYASIVKNGEKFMTPDDFIRHYLGMYAGDDFNEDTVKILASAVDRNRKGEISYQQFEDFERVLCCPDAIFQVAFLLFDLNADDVITFTEFVEILQKTEFYNKTPLNTDAPFMDRYFGRNRDRSIPYCEFSEVLKDLQREHVLECFENADKNSTGYISSHDFENIMTNNRKHLLTSEVKANLSKISEQKMDFATFIAFNAVIYDRELIRRIHLNATQGNKFKEVTEVDFLLSAQAMSHLSLFEVEILYKLCKLIHQKETIHYHDLDNIAPDNYFDHILRQAGINPEGPVKRGVFLILLEILYRFALGVVGGGAGAAAVFPIDLVKTRIQNQRMDIHAKGAKYTGYFDCFFKVLRFEGVRGLYRGLLPQLCGVSPEKATKLTVNDFVRDKFYDVEGNIPYPAEVLAGCCAGACQVVVTNPLEIIKIRLQTAGEVKDGRNVRARDIIRDLGITGLYKGVRACLCRDITFAGIYFSSYGRMKKWFSDDTGYNNMGSLLVAGTAAGVPAAGFATPFDVIKTRLQVIPRPGQTTYAGVFDAARKLRREEGFRAFWKGALARICRSSPQLGITLFTYELLQRIFRFDFGKGPPAGSVHRAHLTDQNHDHIGGYSVAVPVFAGIETKFGISLPKFRKTTNFSD